MTVAPHLVRADTAVSFNLRTAGAVIADASDAATGERDLRKCVFRGDAGGTTTRWVAVGNVYVISPPVAAVHLTCVLRPLSGGADIVIAQAWNGPVNKDATALGQKQVANGNYKFCAKVLWVDRNVPPGNHPTPDQCSPGPLL